jgi:flagellar biosynthesis/type III secretory pathway protein FliH
LKNKTEVIKVSIYEYDKEFEEKKLRKAEYEAGRQDGIEIGRQDGIEIGRQDGIEIGRQDGIEIGRQDGIEIGKRILLEKIIKKKLKKGKSTEQIADELEEDINIIQKVVEKLKSQI